MLLVTVLVRCLETPNIPARIPDSHLQAIMTRNFAAPMSIIMFPRRANTFSMPVILFRSNAITFSVPIILLPRRANTLSSLITDHAAFAVRFLAVFSVVFLTGWAAIVSNLLRSSEGMPSGAALLPTLNFRSMITGKKGLVLFATANEIAQFLEYLFSWARALHSCVDAFSLELVFVVAMRHPLFPFAYLRDVVMCDIMDRQFNTFGNRLDRSGSLQSQKKSEISESTAIL